LPGICFVQEIHLTPSDIAKSYDQLANHWNSEEFPRNNGIDAHRRAISFLEHKRQALDVGCGSSGRFTELLIDHGFDVTGVDVSPRMIELAKKRHPDISFHLADICEWELPAKYDLITAWDSIWHLPLAEQEPVMRKLCEGLNPGGVLIFTTGGVEEPSEKVDSAMGPPMYYSVPGIPNLIRLLSDSDCACRHLEYDQVPELHVYLIAQKAVSQ
jgi:SAM-dependent methyltransferase